MFADPPRITPADRFSFLVRAFTHKRHRHAVLEGLDIISVAVSAIVAFFCYRAAVRSELAFWPSYAAVITIAVVSAGFIFQKCGCYRNIKTLSLTNKIQPIILSLLCFASLLLIIAYYTKTSSQFSRGWVSVWFALLGGLMIGTRTLCEWADRATITKAACHDKVAIIGAGQLGSYTHARLTAGDQGRVSVVGIFDDRVSRITPGLEPFMRGRVDELVEFAKGDSLYSIIVVLPDCSEERLNQILAKVRRVSTNVSVWPAAQLYGALSAPIDLIGGLPFARIISRPLGEWQHLVKLIEDKILGTLLLLLAIPAMFAISIAIKLDSPGPVLFRQPRRGFHHNVFTVYKFRTMRVDACDITANQLTTRGDARLTRVGAWLRALSLDELPQLFNVLRGDMSLVGPRPHPLNARAADLLYQDAVADYAYRYRVNPGITGWAQVSGWRGETDTVEKLRMRVKYDLEYIDRWSLAFDLRIIALTALRGFIHPNAF